MEGVIIPEFGGYDIRANQLIKDGTQPRTQSYSGQNESEKYKTKVVGMFREFERLANNPEGFT